MGLINSVFLANRKELLEGCECGILVVMILEARDGLGQYWKVT